MKFFQIILFTSVTLFLACNKSALEKFNDKNFEGAINVAVKEIEKGNDISRNKNILNKSLKSLLQKTNEDQKSNLNSISASKWEKALSRLQSVESYFFKSRFYMDEENIKSYSDLKSKNQNLNKDIGDNYKNEGIANLNIAKSENNKAKARKAKDSFDKAKKYLENDNDLDGLIQECYKYGTQNIYIEGDSRFGGISNYDIDRTFDGLERESQDFLNIKYERRIDDEDCRMYIEIQPIDYRDQNTTSRKDFSEKIQDGYETKTDSEGNTIKVPKYITVNGSVIITRQKRIAKGEARVDIKSSSNNCEFSDRDFNHSIESNIEKYDIIGDQRAIPSQYKYNSNQSHKSERDIEDEMLRYFYDQIRSNYF